MYKGTTFYKKKSHNLSVLFCYRIYKCFLQDTETRSSDVHDISFLIEKRAPSFPNM